MGLFGKKKETGNQLYAWLDKADAAYSLAFQTKSIEPLEPYVDHTCARSILSKIRADEKAYAGLDRYKHVEWSKHSTNIYTKTVRYDHVKLSHGVVAPVGQDYSEQWTLSGEEKPKVTAIRRVS